MIILNAGMMRHVEYGKHQIRLLEEDVYYQSTVKQRVSWKQMVKHLILYALQILEGKSNMLVNLKIIILSNNAIKYCLE